jgi:hypothetical protein
MLRNLLVVTVVLAVATGCAGTGSPKPLAQATQFSVPAEPSPQGTPITSGKGITPEEAARIAPLAPAELVAVADGARVRLSWPTTREDIAYYRCLRRTAAATGWKQIGRIDPATVTYVDSEPGDGVAIYGIQAVNAAGTASTNAESQAVSTMR